MRLLKTTAKIVAFPFEMIRQLPKALYNNPKLFLMLLVISANAVDAKPASVRKELTGALAQDAFERMSLHACESTTIIMQNPKGMMSLRKEIVNLCDEQDRCGPGEALVHFPASDFWCQKGKLVWRGQDQGQPMPKLEADVSFVDTINFEL